LAAAALGVLALALIAAPFGWTGFLLVPFAAVSLALAGLALRTALQREEGLRLPAAATGLAAVVLVAGLLVPSLLRPSYVSDEGRGPSEDEIRVILLPQFAHAVGELGREWVPADKAALKQGRVRVEVAEAWVGPPPKAAGKKTDRWLYARVRLHRIKTGREIAAGAFADTLAWERRHRATLRNGNGPAAEQLPVVVRMPGDGPSTTADAAVDVTDEVLAFEHPPGLDDLRLELPAAAWGGKGTFRFALPPRFVQPTPPASP
jgi:hypothetical protein